jgi:hypothetical protein
LLIDLPLIHHLPPVMPRYEASVHRAVRKERLQYGHSHRSFIAQPTDPSFLGTTGESVSCSRQVEDSESESRTASHLSCRRRRHLCIELQRKKQSV